MLNTPIQINLIYDTSKYFLNVSAAIGYLIFQNNLGYQWMPVFEQNYGTLINRIERGVISWSEMGRRIDVRNKIPAVHFTIILNKLNHYHFINLQAI